MSPELAQWLQTMAHDLANVKQGNEQLKTGQEHMIFLAGWAAAERFNESRVVYFVRAGRRSCQRMLPNLSC